jgi:hypothetical protein
MPVLVAILESLKALGPILARALPYLLGTAASLAIFTQSDEVVDALGALADELTQRRDDVRAVYDSAEWLFSLAAGLGLDLQPFYVLVMFFLATEATVFTFYGSYWASRGIWRVFRAWGRNA